MKQLPSCAILLGFAVLAAGCAKPTTGSGAREVLPEDSVGDQKVASETELADLRGAMATAVPPGFVPWRSTLPDLPRWSDVPGTVAAAAGEIEMTVLRSRVAADQASFELRGLRGEPGVVEVRRDDRGAPELVRAFIGRFGNPALEERFREAFVEGLEARRIRPALEDLRAPE